MNALRGFSSQCWQINHQFIDSHETDSSDGATSGFAEDNLYSEPEPVYACRMDKVDLLWPELAKDVSIVSKDYRCGKAGEMASLLFVAAQEGNLEIVRALIEYGADIDQGDEKGNTPLMAAATNGRYKMVEFLIEKGASIDKAAKNGATPLYMAAQNGHIRIVKLLLDAGADPKKKWKKMGLLIQVSPYYAAKYCAKDKAMARLIKTAIKDREVTPVVGDAVPLRVSGHQNRYVPYGAIS